MNKYKEDSTGKISTFSALQQNPPSGWSVPTEEDLDEELFEEAQLNKVLELKTKLSDFEIAGFQYAGDIVCAAWEAGETYPRNSLVLASDGKNYKSLKKINLDNDPTISPAWWEEFYPVFKTSDRTTLNIMLKNVRPSESFERYIFRAKNKIKINFSNATNWTAFYNAINDEKDRIMGKYNDYYEEIELCDTIPDVEAIVIDFSE